MNSISTQPLTAKLPRGTSVFNGRRFFAQAMRKSLVSSAVLAGVGRSSRSFSSGVEGGAFTGANDCCGEVVVAGEERVESDEGVAEAEVAEAGELGRSGSAGAASSAAGL